MNTLFDTPDPPPPSNGTATSNAAAESIRPNCKHMREKVYQAVRLAPNGLTREGVADATGMLLQSVCGRVSELMEAGMVREEGTRVLRSGRMGAVLWVVTK